MLEFIEVEVANFLALSSAIIRFERGMTLLGGSNFDASADGSEANGAGKSSLWDAIRWCLFGDVGRDDCKSDDVVNKRVGADCSVRVRFRHGTRSYEVVRYRKHAKHGNAIKLYREGQDITAHTAAETERLLALELAPLEKRVFDYALLVGQGMPYRFIEMSETAKQEFLCSLVGIEVYDRAATRAGEEASSASTAVTKAAEALDAVRRQRDSASRALQDAKTAIAVFHDSIGLRREEAEGALVEIDGRLATIAAQEAQQQVALEAIIAEREREIAVLRAQLGEGIPGVDVRKADARKRADTTKAAAEAAGKEHCARLLVNIAEARSSLEKARAEAAMMNARIATAQREIVEAQQQRETLSVSDKAASIEMRHAEDEAARMTGLGATCPTCRQKVDPRHVETHLAFTRAALEDKRAEREAVREALVLTDGVLADRQKVLRALSDSAQALQSSVSTYDQSIFHDEHEIERISSQAKLVEQNAEATYEREVRAIDAEVHRHSTDISSKISKVQEVIEAQRRDVQRTMNAARSARGKAEADRERARTELSTIGADEARLNGRHDEAASQLQRAMGAVGPFEKVHEEATRHKDHVVFWQRAIPQLRAAAMAQVIAYLNEKASYYLTALYGGALGIEITQTQYGQGSRIKVNLRSDAGAYGLASGGERRRIDLALYLAVSDLLRASSGLACNLMVCDEITDGLSPLGVRKFLELLEERAQNGWAVFVTTHNPAVQQAARFDRVLTVVKRNGVAILN